MVQLQTLMFLSAMIRSQRFIQLIHLELWNISIKKVNSKLQ